eukprot:13310153-Alexandrium_andersonii.AAC.1
MAPFPWSRAFHIGCSGRAERVCWSPLCMLIRGPTNLIEKQVCECVCLDFVRFISTHYVHNGLHGWGQSPKRSFGMDHRAMFFARSQLALMEEACSTPAVFEKGADVRLVE